MKKEKERKKSNKKIYFSLSFLIMFVALFGMTFIDPELMIGWIWDYDIKSQLEFQNRDGIEKNADVVKFRLTYENNDDTDLRVERAINVYINLFDNPENTWIVEKLKNSNVTTLEFTWKTYYEKSLLEQRKIQLEEFYDGN